MPREYPDEIKRKIIERIENGEAKILVSEEVKIPFGTILAWTRHVKRRKSYSYEIKQLVRERIKNGESKMAVSKELGISYPTLLSWTRDLISDKYKGNYGIRGESLLITQNLMEEGYFMGNVPRHSIITLKKYFSIRKTRIKKRCILYLEGSKEQAFRAFMENVEDKVISFQKIANMAQAFGLKDAGQARDDIKKVKEEQEELDEF